LAEARGAGLGELTDAELTQIHPELTPEVRAVLTVTGSVAARDARGGTSPDQVARQLRGLWATVAGLRDRLRR
jgi:argininosuccinate lyase